jgi:hypothetical protein
MKKPEQIKEPDLTNLKKALTNYMNYIDSGDFYSAEKTQNCIYEAVIECFYGPGVWDFINGEN